MLPTCAIARCSVAPAEAFTTTGVTPGLPRRGIAMPAAPTASADAGDGAEVARVLGAVQAHERRPGAPAGRAAPRRVRLGDRHDPLVVAGAGQAGQAVARGLADLDPGEPGLLGELRQRLDLVDLPRPAASSSRTGLRP